MTGSHVVISLLSAPAQAKVARWRSLALRRAIWLGVTVVAFFVIDHFWGASIGGFGMGTFAFLTASGLVWVVVGLVGMWLTSKDAKTIQQGPALAIGRDGVHTPHLVFPWPDLASVVALGGRWGRSSTLTFAGRDGTTVVLPMDYLDTLPATIDSAVRTMSGGRARIDFSRLDD